MPRGRVQLSKLHWRRKVLITIHGRSRMPTTIRSKCSKMPPGRLHWYKSRGSVK